MFARGGDSEKFLGPRKVQGPPVVIIGTCDALIGYQTKQKRPSRRTGELISTVHAWYHANDEMFALCLTQTRIFPEMLCQTLLCSVSGLGQLSCPSRAKDCHDTETTVEKNHGVGNKTPH
jgi:hypothetical protein